MADGVLTVMVSSNFQELQRERATARDAVQDQRMLAPMMETESAIRDRGIIQNSRKALLLRCPSAPAKASPSRNAPDLRPAGPMKEIHARIHVSADHRISGTAPLDAPPGEHDVTISLQPPARQRFRAADLPRHDVAWDGSVSLHREDMYGDDGP